MSKEEKKIEQQIADALEVMANACWTIKDKGGCGSDGCPIWGYACVGEETLETCADFLNPSGIAEFLNFAHNEIDNWRYEHMTEEERRYEYESEQANLERSSLDD